MPRISYTKSARVNSAANIAMKATSASRRESPEGPDVLDTNSDLLRTNIPAREANGRRPNSFIRNSSIAWWLLQISPYKLRRTVLSPEVDSVAVWAFGGIFSWERFIETSSESW